MRCKVAFIVLLATFAFVAGKPESPPSETTPVDWPHWPTKKPSTSTSTTTPEPPTPTTTTSTTTPQPPTPPPTSTTTQPPTSTTTQPPSPPPTTTTTTSQPPTPPPITTTPKPPPTPPPTPAPAPTPAPSPTPADRGNWTVQGDNVTCIYLQAALSANVKYTKINKEVGHAPITIPNNATASGECGNSSQVLKLAWNEHSAVFVFHNLVNSSQYDLHLVNLTLAADNNTFPNISTEIKSLHFVSSAPLFVTSKSFSYQCSVQKEVPLLNGTAPNGTEILGTLDFNKIHLQAFSDSHAARFGAPEDCDEDASDVVPIVVGCALAGLVVIILGVYVWGRHRTNRGYLSM